MTPRERNIVGAALCQMPYAEPGASMQRDRFSKKVVLPNPQQGPTLKSELYSTKLLQFSQMRGSLQSRLEVAVVA